MWWANVEDVKVVQEEAKEEEPQGLMEQLQYQTKLLGSTRKRHQR